MCNKVLKGKDPACVAQAGTIDVKEMALLGPAIEYGVILYALRALESVRKV